MKLYLTAENENKKEVKIGGNTALTIKARVGNKIVGEIVLLEGSLALYDTKGNIKGEIQSKGKSQKGETPTMEECNHFEKRKDCSGCW